MGEKKIKATVTFVVVGPAVVDGETYTPEMIIKELKQWLSHDAELAFGEFKTNEDGSFVTATGPDGEYARFNVVAEEIYE